MTDTIADPRVADSPPPRPRPFSIPASATSRTIIRRPSSARCWRSRAAFSARSACRSSRSAGSSQILLPAVLLGLAPLILTAWASEASGRLAEATGVGAALVALAVFVVARFGWRPLFRLTESNFWSLNALAVQPGYAFWRELIRHVAERFLQGRTGMELARMRAASCAAAGVLLFVVAALVAALVWPATRWSGSVADVLAPHLLIVPTIANAIALMSAYLAVAALVWGFADATADQPLDLAAFDDPPPGARVWRVAHLSDIHIVGERYGFRIESGRAGPCGNGRLRAALARLAEVHDQRPLDLVLVTGDMTDAGTSAEWAEFFDIFDAHPGTRRAHPDPARKPRRQYRRPRQSGAPRPAVQPNEDAAPDARPVGDGGGAGARAR